MLYPRPSAALLRCSRKGLVSLILLLVIMCLIGDQFTKLQLGHESGSGWNGHVYSGNDSYEERLRSVSHLMRAKMTTMEAHHSVIIVIKVWPQSSNPKTIHLRDQFEAFKNRCLHPTNFEDHASVLSGYFRLNTSRLRCLKPFYFLVSPHAKHWCDVSSVGKTPPFLDWKCKHLQSWIAYLESFVVTNNDELILM